MTAGGDKADRINFVDLMQKKNIYTRKKSRMAKKCVDHSANSIPY